jgi:16S rRNA (uracil1498-N3)-methyltransferase
VSDITSNKTTRHFAGEELFWCRLVELNGFFLLSGDETKHINQVMRHVEGDIIHTTCGDGVIQKVRIRDISKNEITVEKISEVLVKNRLINFQIAIPRLKNIDKIEMVIEKLVEIGYNRFIFFESDNCVGKGFKLERWEKVAISAAKQSFNPFTPILRTAKNVDEIFKIGDTIIGFDLEAESDYNSFVPEPKKRYTLVIGPEGGLSKRELGMFKNENLFQLTKNRLRSETALLYSAFRISTLI